MTTEKDLEELFSSAITSFDDNDEFTHSLSRNLTKIDCVKSFYDQKKHRYLIKLALASAIGAASTILAIILYPKLPFDATLIKSLTQSGSILILSGQAKVISTLALIIMSSSILYCFASLCFRRVSE